MDIAALAFPTAMLVAFALGALSFLSPCVLPIVPSYLAYMSGARIDEIEAKSTRSKLVISAFYFVLGLSTVFFLLALAVYRLASDFLTNQPLFNLISGLIIILFGLHFLGVFNFAFLNREMRFEAKKSASPLAAYALGLAFAFGWSPCLGPALTAILGMVANEATLGSGLILMGIYAAGLGLPFILSALLIERMIKSGSKLRSKLPLIQKVMGALLVLIGLLMITGNFSQMSNWLLDHFPSLGVIG